MTLDEAREKYDWEGCAPLLNSSGLLIGVVVSDKYREPDYEMMKWDATLQAFRLKV